MPKNSRKGSKSRSGRGNQLVEKDEDLDQDYAEVLRALGNGRFRFKFMNGEEGNAKLKGSMSKGKKFTKVQPGHLVLVQKDPTTTGKDKYYIIHRYNDDDKRTLTRMGELDVVNEVPDDSAFVFEDEVVQGTQGEMVLDADFFDSI